MPKIYGYIYMIVNNINGHTYVGKRKLHKNKQWYNDNYMGSGVLLKRAQDKYGIENFEKFLITWTSSEKDACEKEIFWIAHYKSLGKAEYNIQNGGQGDGSYRKDKSYEELFGEERAKELKSKLSNSHIGHVPWNKGTKGEMTAWNKGLDTPEEVKEKQSQAKKERPVRYWKGKTFSDEHKRKLAEARKGKSPANKGIVGKHWYTNGIEDKQYFPEEVPEGWVKGRNKVKGRKQSEEEKQKRREAALKRTDYHKFHLTDEQKQKLSWAKKEYYGSLK